MNAQRIPTQAENAAMVRRSRNHTIRQQRGLERYVEIQADAPEPVNFCAVEPEPAMLGMFDAMRDEFGVTWPLWISAWIALVLISAGLTSVYFWVNV